MFKKTLSTIGITLIALLVVFNAEYADGYSDIKGHWAKDYINQLSEKGIISGYSDGTFRPDDNITVAEFTKLILTSSGTKYKQSKVWYDAIIDEAKRTHIIQDGEFDNYGKRLITRGEMARMIARQIGEASPKAEKTSFKDDNQIPDSLKRFIKVVSDKQIVTGLPNGNFDAKGNATRAEAATMIYRMINISTNENARKEDIQESLDIDSYSNQIDVGTVHTVILKKDGTVWSCGWNIFGTLGNGTNEDAHTPVQAKGLNNVDTISAGFFHTVALKTDGTVWAWGLNDYGQLGDETVEDRNIPVQVKGLNNVMAVAGGWRHTAALKSDGTVWVWGENQHGELGDGTNVISSNTPVQVKGLNNVVSISAGDSYTLALKSDGTVWAWGWNGGGQLGDGTLEDRNVPIQVKNLNNVVKLSAGLCHSLAIKKDGSIWAWGVNSQGQLGDGTLEKRNIPIEVKNLNNVVNMSAGHIHSLALKEDGTVWAWGNNEEGKLGTESNGSSSVPIKAENLTNVVAIATGEHYTVVLKDDGSIWSWGGNWYGQLGDGTDKDSNVPVRVLIE